MVRVIVFACFMLLSFTTRSQVYKWYKGNTHTHSLWSDGNDFPEMIIDWYKSHGYDFLALSDHNTLGDSIKWVELPTNPFRQNRYREYQQRFGMRWVESRLDSGKIFVRLKQQKEYRPLFEQPGKFLLIPAEEITQKFETKHIHINAINVKDLIGIQNGNSVADVIQKTLDEVYAQRKRTGQPILVHLNHPNFYYSITLEDLIGLKGERFIEIFNGHPLVHNYGDSTHIGMEEMWDALIVSYMQQKKPMIYGLATDDAHNYLEFKIGTSNPGRGWIMVRSKSLTPADLIAAMEAGEFYSTTGVELSSITHSKNRLEVSVKKVPGISYKIQFWGGKGAKGMRTLLKEINGSQANYLLNPDEWYVRAKIISTKLKDNPYEAGDVETAWTQPVVRQ